eukprot:7376625-Prymnesium_polylepis.1
MSQPWLQRLQNQGLYFALTRLATFDEAEQLLVRDAGAGHCIRLARRDLQQAVAYARVDGASAVARVSGDVSLRTSQAQRADVAREHASCAAAAHQLDREEAVIASDVSDHIGARWYQIVHLL